MDEMEEFKQTFFAECSELLIDMEERLMSMEEGEVDIDDLNAIFRCAHSIKGGAGAFSLDAVMHFTHTLEALLDRMREGELEVTRAAIDLLLKSADIVTQMLAMEQDGDGVPEGYGEDISIALKAFVSGEEEVSAAGAPSSGGNEAPVEAAEKADVSGAGFIINFSPKAEFFSTGNDPLNIINALSKMGEMSVEADYSGVPLLNEIDPIGCHLKWKITLATAVTEAEIHEVFEFVDDVSDITIAVKPSESDGGDDVQKEDVSAASAQDSSADSSDISAEASEPATPAPSNETKTKKIAAKPTPSAGSIRVDLDKIDRLVNMVGELVITEAMLRSQVHKNVSGDSSPGVQRGLDELTHHTRELQEAVMAVRMQPVKSIFSRMPRLVRETAGKLGKDVQLVMVGEGTEVDKTVVEKLGDPLTHMIRNSVDHGVEMPDIRLENGKNPQGTIQLSAFHRSGRIIIEITDDGAGISRERVLEKAKEKGLVQPDAQPSDEEIDHMIFMAGFSTAETVSDVSGRGVGMDVVRKNIESIGGSVSVDNRPGEGATFTISLPLTLAILDGMIVRVGEEFYITPITAIIESLRPEPEAVNRVEGHCDVINVRGEFIPLVYLHDVFEVSGATEDASKALTVLVETGRNKMGLVVDELIGQQQVVIKSLQENADPVEGISGATILGDGQVSLILDIDQLWLLSQKHDAASDNNKKLSVKVA